LNFNSKKSDWYIFTLTLSVDNDYSTKIGIPKEGIAKVVVEPKFTTTTSTTLTSTLIPTQTSLKPTQTSPIITQATHSTELNVEKEISIE
jgi:hypothetical protein